MRGLFLAFGRPGPRLVQTESGVDALRCTGLPETLLAPNVPADLSAKPTLSVRARAIQPVEATVTLTYLSSNFDWRAHYVATLAHDGKTMALFAWLTLANGDQTGFADADTMAVAGRLNREYVDRMYPDTRAITVNCWPMQRTHQTDFPPPPPPPEAEREYDESIVVTRIRLRADRNQRFAASGPVPDTLSRRRTGHLRKRQDRPPRRRALLGSKSSRQRVEDASRALSQPLISRHRLNLTSHPPPAADAARPTRQT